MSTVKEGYLLKFSPGVIKYWKQRYFLLTSDGYLNIYDQPRGSLLKKVNVSQQTTVLQMGAGIQAKIPALPNNHHTVDCVFMLGTKGKKYLFLANSRPEFDSWMQAINQHRNTAMPHSTQHSYPAHPSYPPQNSYPPQPSYPAQPSYPPQPAYPSTSQPQPSTNPSNLGFENLTLGAGGYSGAAAYPPQQPYPGNAPYAANPPPQPYPNQQHHYPQQPAYGQPAYGYQQPPPAQYQAYHQQQPHSSHSSGGLGAMGALGGLGALGAVVGKKGKKHKKALGGAAAVLAGGYALKKASKFGGSWGSWSSGSFGSFGSFGSGCSWGS